MARRLGSARMSKTDSTLRIYSERNIRVKVYNKKSWRENCPTQAKGRLEWGTEIATEGAWVLWFAVGGFGDVRGDLLEDEFAD